METKRSKAQSLETTFIHDFPDVFKLCLRDIWKGSGVDEERVPIDADLVGKRNQLRVGQIADRILLSAKILVSFYSNHFTPWNLRVDLNKTLPQMTCSELILSPDETRLVERKRYPGENTLAMVAWKMILRTPGMDDAIQSPILPSF